MVILYFLLLPAMWFDIRTFRIPNRLILLGATAAAVYRVANPGEFHFLYYLLSMVGMFFLLIPFFKLKAIGGGDVKLLSICALILGLKGALSISLYALLFGGIFSIIYLVFHRFFSRQKTIERHVIHFSIPIFLGVAAQHMWGGVLWQIS